ncbi:hypothetical protein ABTL82_19650, partial [Acinetobacter baumannii]
MNKKFLAYAAFFLVLTIVFLIFVFKGTDIMHKSTLPQRAIVQPFAFVTQDGQSLTNADLAGKVYVAEYFFTT